jgi:hypothetical protein
MFSYILFRNGLGTTIDGTKISVLGECTKKKLTSIKKSKTIGETSGHKLNRRRLEKF